MRLPHEVTRLRAPLVVDGKGNLLRSWSTAVATTGMRAWVQPVSTDEQTAGQERVVSRWRVFLPPGTDLVASDRVQWRGLTFMVDGEVQWFDGPSGDVHHAEALLRLVTGA